MAKQAVIISLFVLLVAFMFILSESGVLNSLLIFLLVGAIPGTSVTIPPSLMLFMTGASLWAILFHLTAGKFIGSRQTKRLIKKHIARKQRMPKRRYGQI